MPNKNPRLKERFSFFSKNPDFCIFILPLFAEFKRGIGIGKAAVAIMFCGVLSMPNAVLAASYCTKITCTNSEIQAYNAEKDPNATATTPVCFQYTSGSYTQKIYYPNSTSCKSGYDLKSGTASSVTWSGTEACSNQSEVLSYIHVCESKCNTANACGDCSDSQYNITGGSVSMATQCRFTGTWPYTGCKCYREFTTTCNNYYYGNGTVSGYDGSGVSYLTCKVCPNVDGDNVGYTNLAGSHNSPGNASDITGCFAKKDQIYMDTTGTGSYKFTDNCFYTK